MNILALLKRIMLEYSESSWTIPLRLLRAIKRNPLKQLSIMKYQKMLLRKNYPACANKLIIFVTPNIDIVNGGILIICSHYEETIKIRNIHRAEVLLCTGPDQKLLLKYTKFKNNNYIFGLLHVFSYFYNLEDLMIHLPEYMTESFLKSILKKKYISILERINNIHINIMLQNLEGLKFMKSIKDFERFGKVTCTTAHQRYTTLELRKKLGVPLHLLSVRVDPEFYNRKRYLEKENLMIVSPDEHPIKSKVLNLINYQFPQMRIKIISNITFEEYKKTIEQAKWALTFGEGLDGYFVETIYSGGISFSVYKSEYFTKDYSSLRTVYENYDLLVERICTDIKYLDDEKVYADYQDEQYQICKKHYNYTQYAKNLKLFYKCEYTYK